ncbi:MAG: N(G),N(G)-dimethylarginine dimethylaminohydrolase [Saprospiraceae bacterium]
MPTAITRPVSPKMAECELTHFDRQPIDIMRAIRQHAAYEDALQELGCKIIRALPAPENPDSVFVEDCAVVLDELAIITNPGASSRKSEIVGLTTALGPHRPLHFILAPGVLDGGDVLVIGKQIWVGQSSRSNAAALEQMRSFVAPHGYTVTGVEVTGCLHLKSAVTQIGKDMVLLNPDWVDAGIFRSFKIVETHPDEPGAANALLVGDTVIFPADFPLTALRLAEAGVELLLVDNSEVIKAEGGVTCCSVIFAEK